MKISEIIKDKYKLRIPPIIYYELLADVQEAEEEPKPMVEIDLYSVIKQKYIEREVLDKIRAEIESKLDNINRLYNQDNQYDDGAIDSLQYALDIIDKYRESEEQGMTIGGALSELNNLLNADDIPCYYKPSIKAVMDTIALEQESKPMVEIDLYSVIKQKYIEREILDKLRAELHATAEMHEDGGYYIRAEWINECFDKYKAETEESEG